MPSWVRGVVAGSIAGPIIVLAFGVSAAHADPCSPDTGQATCFDSDALFTPAAPSRFAGISASSALPAGALALGVDLTYLTRPVIVTTRSPDPSGRELTPVNHVVDLAVAAAYFPVRRLEVSLVIPFAAHRSGSGLVGVTSQNGTGLGAALRDVRIGAGYALVDARISGAASVTVMPRLDVSLPTGNETTFAGERTVLFWPRVSGGIEIGRFFAESEVGARLRQPVEFGGTRLGTELTASLGVGASILDRGLLDIGAEAWLRLSPIAQPRESGGVVDRTLAPSEWMVSFRSRFDHVALRVGAGTAIPFSSETRLDANDERITENLGGLTAPDFRAVFSARYTFGP